jgi:DNA modification methylase
MSFYFDIIIEKSLPYFKKVFTQEQLQCFLDKISFLKNETDTKKVIHNFIKIYIDYIKEIYQKKDKDIDPILINFLNDKNSDIKILWGDCYSVMKKMHSESIHLIVTSPPYYNAREYAQWKNLNDYLQDMSLIIKEMYRILDNHRVCVFNIGDIFDNDNIITTSTWGKRRIPLGAYFIKIFEEEGFTFVDDFIWDKGEVQSERHKNKNKPYPFYQYPMNCYEHILIFHKHRLDETPYPCPVCGCLKVNSNAYSGIGIKSWECKNGNCFTKSKSGRGKRFSLKTLITQENQNKENEIEHDFIKKWRRDIVKINPVIKINSKGENIVGHTAPFPSEIPEFAIKMFSYKGEKVLDPFAGIFTTSIIAKKLGRIGIGIEKDKNLKESIIKNIKKHFTDNSFDFLCVS